MVNRNVIIAEVGPRVMQAQKILIIDDSATSCALMERALHGEGYQILIATDGREGLAMAIQEQPHCIILDVVLPGMNGFEVCRTLRTRPKYRDLPIIMVSTKNTPLDKSWALRQGATHYLAKPFKPNDILELVKGALLRYAPPAQFEEPASTSKAQ
ncbi:MAG: response regulator, partial [Ktedonobacteraceae bacterium]|nr:response regulator [Ktedonobacteraceae bacterium]